MKIVNVEDEYKKFQDMDRDEVLKILEWVHQQSHLPKITEREAITFYHSCYYSAEMTKRTIDRYYTFRTQCPEFFANLDVTGKDLKRAVDAFTIIILKDKTPDGCIVIMGGLNNYEARNFVFADAVKLYSMMFDLSLIQNGVQIGCHMVIDLKGCTLGHVARVGPFAMKKFLTYLQDAVPVRLKGFHLVNIVPFTNKILALMKPFMKKELFDIFHIHSSFDDFYKFVPKDILPEEYGGQNGSMTALRKNAYENLIEYRQYFLDEENTRRINGKQRSNKSKNGTKLFASESNFKKLDFD